MQVWVNERPVEVADGATIGQLVQQLDSRADLRIVNGYPAADDAVLSPGDRVVLIRRGERPSDDELEVLLVARHTPGVHEKLKKACVGVAGVGGLGSTAAICLARVGVGRLVLVDFDVVEPSNLNRQQYFTDQLGLPKVVALAQTIARINPLVRLQTHPVRLTPDNVPAILGPCDVVIDAFDRADQKAMLVESLLAVFPEKPLVLGCGMAGYGANELLGTRAAGSIWACGDQCSEAGPGFGLMAPRVGVVAAMQANQVMEILLGPDPRVEEARLRVEVRQ